MGTKLLMEGYRDKHSHLLGLEHWQGIWFSLPNSENYVWPRVGALERLEKIDKSWLEKKKISRTGDDISQRPGNLLYFLEKRGGTISPTLLFHIYSLPLIFFHSSLPPLCSFPPLFSFSLSFLPLCLRLYWTETSQFWISGNKPAQRDPRIHNVVGPLCIQGESILSPTVGTCNCNYSEHYTWWFPMYTYQSIIKAEFVN